jgi:hypothetical protein
MPRLFGLRLLVVIPSAVGVLGLLAPMPVHASRRTEDG